MKILPLCRKFIQKLSSTNNATNTIKNQLGIAKVDVGIWGKNENWDILNQYVPISIKKLEPKGIQTFKDMGLSQEEHSFYKCVLDEFREFSPIAKKANPYCETSSTIAEHINGATSEFSTSIRKVKNGWQFFYENVNPQFELRENGKNLFVDIDKGTLNGDKDLINELKIFLQDTPPTQENLEKFLEYRDVKFLKENGITNCDAKIKSILKGKEIAKHEENYHTQRQKMYETLWKPLHTEKFYRVVGEEELKKVLSGKTIVSKNSQARYGRSCVDITNYGDYHDIFYGETKYRITFKVKDADGGYHTSLTEKISDFRPEKSHYQIPSYSKEDIAEIHVWNGSDWVELR